jgi:1-deoxy-D-xylulose-5-phosphate reductoisomerase
MPAFVAANGRPLEIALLGSTGSIGTQTLEVVDLFPDRFRIRSLTAGGNYALLAEQALKYRPELVVIRNEAVLPDLRELLAGSGVRVEGGAQAVESAVEIGGIDIVVAAIVGYAGLRPVVRALERGLKVAIANKETLVVAGELVEAVRRQHGGTLLPVDSEHSAILQSMAGESRDAIERLILTASGGPFRNHTAEALERVTAAEALRHPNWSMGSKITIDSATLMNKGLEVIEAYWLFGLPAERIDVLIHPQSIVHSMVEFVDGSTKAQLGAPDMKVPIQYALTYPERLAAPHPRIDWQRISSLEFGRPDTARFPCLRLAYEALRSGGLAPAVLNAANEAAVELFLQDRIGFMDIPRLIEKALTQVPSCDVLTLEELAGCDAEARRRVKELARATAD